MKILVTGANGLIARKIIKQLSNNPNHQVVATSQKPLPLSYGVESFTVNLIYADINKLVETIRPDAIIHCAAVASPDACEVDRFSCNKLNVEVTSRLASSCRDYGAHLTFISTDFVFDGKKGNYNETDLVSPVSYYGESKLEAEKILTEFNTNVAIIRTSLVFGYEAKLSRPNIVLKVIEKLKKGKQYRVPFDQIRNPTYAEDVSSATIKMVESRLGGIVHIAGSEKIAVSDFAVMTARVFNLDDSLLIPVSTKELSEPAPRPLNTTFDISKAVSLIGYKPTALIEALNLVKEQFNFPSI